jgi:RIO kinase 1
MSRCAQVELPQSFYEANLITDVRKVVQSGKEATVYCCRAHPSTGEEYLAAKVYRPRAFRSFQNDAIYLQGRSVHGIDSEGSVSLGRGRINRRLCRAVRKKSRTGREAQFGSWISREFASLGRLHAAGADVPRPVEWTGSALLLEYVGEGEMPAPRLALVRLDVGEARRLFARVLRNVEIALACDVVHGDLSAFNILYRGGEVTIIDFPQSVDPWINPSALELLERDLRNVCDYFVPYGIRAEPSRLAERLWSRAMRGQF